MKPIKISERTQAVLILVTAVAALWATAQFLLWPLLSQYAENKKAREALGKNPYAKISIETLRAAAAVAKKDSDALNQNWFDTVRRLNTLHGARADTPRIEFQVAYIAARTHLGQKAARLNIKLPPTFDVPELVTSSEAVRERLNQLKTVEKLLDLVFAQHISGITGFKNLPTILHHDTEQKPICEEYPVEVEFTTSFDSLFYLFSGVFEEDGVFVFSKIRVTSDPRLEQILHVKAVMSSLIF